MLTVGFRPSGGERARIMAADGIHPALSATDYKQPIAVALSESEILTLLGKE